MEAFTTKGHWWLPSNPDHKVEGDLSFDPRGRSQLEIFGTFQTGPVKEYTAYLFPKRVPIILGQDDSGQAITLVNCSEEPFDPSGKGFPWEYFRYRPRTIFCGHHFRHVDEVVFSKVSVDYYGLQVWADPRPHIRVAFIRPVEALAEEVSTSNLLVSAGKFSVRICRTFPQDMDDQSTGESINRFAQIDFLTENPLDFDAWLGAITDFQVFISLAMRVSTWPTMVQARQPEIESKQISIHYHPVTEFRKTENLSPSNMYFTLQEALPFLERGLKNWFEKSGKLERVIQMYNWAVSREIFLDEQFMIFARAVEVIHRQIHDEPYIEESRYKEICEALKETLNSLMPSSKNDRFKDLEGSIHTSLNYANRPSLRRRLKDIGEKYSACSERLFANYKPFIDDVVVTRNYLTHFDEKDKRRAKLEFRELYSMRERLRLLLEVCLLSELGLDNSEIRRIVHIHVASLPI